MNFELFKPSLKEFDFSKKWIEQKNCGIGETGVLRCSWCWNVALIKQPSSVSICEYCFDYFKKHEVKRNDYP